MAIKVLPMVTDSPPPDNDEPKADGAAAAADAAPSPDDACPFPPADFYRAGNYQALDSVGYLMRRVLTSLSQRVQQRLEQHGLTHAQWMPLFKAHRGDATTVAELSRFCDTDPGAMTRMVDRLEAKGLMTRERSTLDRRVVHVGLTPEGERVAREIPAVLAQTLNEHLAGFSGDEYETLKQLLRRMLTNGQALQGVSAQDGEPPMPAAPTEAARKR